MKKTIEDLFRLDLVDVDPKKYYFWLGDDEEVYVYEDGKDFLFETDEDDELGI